MDPQFLPMMPTGNDPESSPANELSESIADLVPDPVKMVYDVLVDRDGRVGIRMTLTAPACPAAQTLPVEVRDKARSVTGVTDAKVEIVWDPPWSKERMSEAAKLQLGLW